MSDPMTPDSLLDDTGRVAVDLPCVKCGYNLRLTDRDAVCPECGTATCDSLISPARWLQRIRLGLIFAMLAIACSAVLVIPLALKIGAGGFMAAIVADAMIAALVAKGVAVWLLTEPVPPVLRGIGESDKPRRIARIVIPLAAAGHLIAFWTSGLLTTMAQNAARQSLTKTLISEWNASSYAIWYLLLGVGYIALGTHFGRVAARLGPERRASLLRRLLWLLGIATLGTGIFAMINRHPSWLGAAQSQSGTTSSILFGSLAGGLAVGSFVVAGALVPLAFRWHRDLGTMLVHLSSTCSDEGGENTP